MGMDPSMLAGAAGGGGMGSGADPMAMGGGAQATPMASHAPPGKRQKHKHARKGHKRHKGKKKK